MPAKIGPKPKTRQRCQNEALLRAVDAAGGVRALGKALGKSGGITYWMLNSIVPGKYVVAIEKLTRVSRHDLRPDLYPKK